MNRSIRFVLALALVALGSTAALAEGTFYRYTAPDGSLAFTDSEKKIPAASRASVEVDDFDALAARVANRITPMAISAEELAQTIHVPTATVVEEVNPNRQNDCTGPTTVTSERRQFGALNRTVYIVTDPCGRVVAETLENPTLNIVR